MNRERERSVWSVATAQKRPTIKVEAVSDGRRTWLCNHISNYKDGLGCLSVVCTLCVQQIETGRSDLLGARLFHAPHGNESLCTHIKRDRRIDSSEVKRLFILIKRWFVWYGAGRWICASQRGDALAITRRNSSSWEFIFSVVPKSSDLPTIFSLALANLWLRCTSNLIETIRAANEINILMGFWCTKRWPSSIFADKYWAWRIALYL